MGNTAAEKRGDGIDWFLMQRNVTEKNHLLEQEADYPETVLSILRAYIKIWKPPSGAIPSRRQKSKHKQWVEELDLLNQICPAHHEEIFEIALEIYSRGNKFIISHPLALKELLVSAAGEFNRKTEKLRIVVQQEVKEEVEELASPTEVKAAVRNLKSLLEG